MIKLEIILLFLALGYSIYYVFDRLFLNYESLKTLLTGSKRERKKRIKTSSTKRQEQRTQGKKETSSDKVIQTNKKKAGLREEDKTKLKNILKRVHLNKVRGYNDKARTLIIEGLTIDKNNRELNMELAEIYQTEEKYSKAEYIYKDILEKHEDDIDTLKLLAGSLEMQDKNKEAIMVYKTALKKRKADVDVLEKLSDLTFEVQDYSSAMTYTKDYLKQMPRNAEKIAMVGYCLEKNNNIEKAISEYERVLQIQPYNNEIQTRITKLQTKIKKK